MCLGVVLSGRRGGAPVGAGGGRFWPHRAGGLDGPGGRV